MNSSLLEELFAIFFHVEDDLGTSLKSFVVFGLSDLESSRTVALPKMSRSTFLLGVNFNHICNHKGRIKAYTELPDDVFSNLTALTLEILNKLFRATLGDCAQMID